MGLNGIYPVNIYPYNIQIKKKQSVEGLKGETEQKSAPSNNYDLNEQKPSSSYKQTIDYSSETINISRIIVDFKNTLAAIGAPKEINEEIKTYLKLVELQSLKENPSQKIIKSNLTNASSILDGYISETLNKPSKVVKDWIDALFQQKIDYKSDKDITKNTFEKTEEISTQKTDITTKENNENNLTVKNASKNETSNKLEQLYKQTEKIIDSGDIDNALSMYDKLLPVSKKTGNTKIETKIYMDKAYACDISGDPAKALKNYNKAANIAFETGEQKLQAKAHYNMASIYDDFGLADAAINHYYESISLDGATDNLKGQTLTLNDIGNLYSSQYDYKQALDHFKVGYSLTSQTGDKEGKACILSNTANVFSNLGFDDKALKYYKESIKIDSKIGNVEGYAKSYEKAGDIMLRNNQINKAENLYKKSLIASQKIGDSSWSAKMLDKLQQNSLSY